MDEDPLLLVDAILTYRLGMRQLRPALAYEPDNMGFKGFYPPYEQFYWRPVAPT